MKKFTFKEVAAVLVVATALLLIGSCRKNEGTTNLVIVPPIVPGERQLTVSVLGSANQDSLSGYSLHIKSPSGETDKTVAGTRYTIKDPEAGTYTFTATLNGYIAASKNVIVILPTAITTSLLLDAPLFLTKSAPVVTITALSGGTISVKEEEGQPATPVVATVTVPANTTFTLANGTQPASVPITVTNIPPATQTAAVEVVNGQPEVDLKQLELVNKSLVVKKLDLQPEGLTFSKPMVVSMYVGDVYDGLTQAEKVTEQQYLFFNYLKPDNTVEQVAPDHFSLNRDTAFFKISHFSQWTAVVKKYSITESVIWTPWQSKSISCGGSVDHYFSYDLTNNVSDNDVQKIITASTDYTITDLNASIGKQVNITLNAGYSQTVSWRAQLKRYTGTRAGSQIVIDLLTGVTEYAEPAPSVCHNQGGGN